jgi:hypothetical protein
VSLNLNRFASLKCLVMYIVLLFFNHDVIRVEFTSQDHDLWTVFDLVVSFDLYTQFSRLSGEFNKGWTIYCPVYYEESLGCLFPE